MNSYERAVRELTDKKRTKIDSVNIAFENALSSDEKLYAAYLAYQQNIIKSAENGVKADPKIKITYISELKRVGIDLNDFDPAPSCTLCNDTGFVDGKYCKCVIKKVIEDDRDNLTLPLLDFDKYYSSAPQSAKKIYNAAKKFIDTFPHGDKVFFNVIGRPGTGKTVLASAMSSAFVNKGASTVSVTAFDFVRRAVDYRKQFSIDNYVDRFSPMLDCDVLILDDLGKETIFKNVTIEYLYNVIDERWRRRLVTITTSNLTPDGIVDRYGEAIMSRLLDKNIALNFILDDKNLRVQ